MICFNGSDLKKSASPKKLILLFLGISVTLMGCVPRISPEESKLIEVLYQGTGQNLKAMGLSEFKGLSGVQQAVGVSGLMGTTFAAFLGGMVLQIQNYGDFYTVLKAARVSLKREREEHQAALRALGGLGTNEYAFVRLMAEAKYGRIESKYSQIKELQLRLEKKEPIEKLVNNVRLVGILALLATSSVVTGKMAFNPANPGYEYLARQTIYGSFGAGFGLIVTTGFFKDVYVKADQLREKIRYLEKEVQKDMLFFKALVDASSEK
jgi:hypothetical protein